MVFTSDLLPTKSEGASRLRPTFVLLTNSFPGIFLAEWDFWCILGEFGKDSAHILRICHSFNMKNLEIRNIISIFASVGRLARFLPPQFLYFGGAVFLFIHKKHQFIAQSLLVFILLRLRVRHFAISVKNRHLITEFLRFIWNLHLFSIPLHPSKS